MPVIGVISLPFAIGTLIQLAKERPDQLASAVPYLLGIPGLLIAIPMLLFRLPQFMGTQKRIKEFWDEMPNAVVELKRLDEDADVPPGRIFTIG